MADRKAVLQFSRSVVDPAINRVGRCRRDTPNEWASSSLLTNQVHIAIENAKLESNK